jgi:hypothetical protein
VLVYQQFVLPEHGKNDGIYSYVRTLAPDLYCRVKTAPERLHGLFYSFASKT